ncbi:MAG TPA: hypothetical protein V6C89_11055 [Drouetiella sp.]|jgi:hypothetical protein
MPAAAAGLFIIDFVFRPFAKILEKWPMVMLLLVLLLYTIIGYIVVKSVYFMPDQQKPY